MFATGDIAYVNWDVIFDFASTTAPFPAGQIWTWDKILAMLKANPLTVVLALSLAETGGGGPDPNRFPKDRCPKGPAFSDPTKSPGKDWSWRVEDGR